MVLQIEIDVLEDLIKGKRSDQVQLIFDDIISYISEYLNLNSVYSNIKLQVVEIAEIKHDNILDVGVNRTFQDRSITIEINSKYAKFCRSSYLERLIIVLYQKTHYVMK